MANFVSDRRIYLNADRTKVVKEDDEEAAYLLAAEGGEVSEEDAKKYGLSTHEAKPKSLLESEKEGLELAMERGSTEEARVRRQRISDLEEEEKAQSRSGTKARTEAPAIKSGTTPTGKAD